MKISHIPCQIRLPFVIIKNSHFIIYYYKIICSLIKSITFYYIIYKSKIAEIQKYIATHHNWIPQILKFIL